MSRYASASVVVAIFAAGCTVSKPGLGAPPVPLDARTQAAGAPTIPAAGIVAPSPASGKSVVVGRMMTSGPKPVPYIGVFFLASPIRGNTPDAPPLFAFSEIDAPKSVQDASGRFAFAGVAPGEYAIIIWSPAGGTVILDERTHEPLVVKAEAGKTVDLGVVLVP